MRSDPAHHSHLHCHLPSRSFSSTTQPSLQNTKLTQSFLSLHAIIMSSHWVQHTRSTAYTEYNIHQAQHTPSTTYTMNSIHRLQNSPKIVCRPSIVMLRSWQLNVSLPFGVPPYTIDHHWPAFCESIKIKIHCIIPTGVS
jgi:hypothetical protein